MEHQGAPASTTAPAAGANTSAGAEFTRELAASLAAGPIGLPSFPDVALRVQQVLADDAVSTEMVVRIVGAEPMLAARVVSLANSAALNPSSHQVTDLRTAVARMGFDSLRAAAVSFAMAQLGSRAEHAHIEPQLARNWRDSVSFAATASVVARRSQRMSADTALFAALVAGVGKVYILTRAGRHPQLLADAFAYKAIVREWHIAIAKRLLASWHVAEEVIEAVEAYERRNDETRPGPPLADVLACAALINRFQGAPARLTGALPLSHAAMRIGLAHAPPDAIIADAAGELSKLNVALGR
ncbi:MAG: HDOD domain-containing protein [Gammaproteobacteria bacterium]|nr:HDOD domain-containing protein [Gammaproteobacteria bacterium]MDE2252353.1 HDOD domain-containing protein [Gammaproteobacteria bacterium]